MNHLLEDSARKNARITKERHLDLNQLMKEQFCSEKVEPSTKGKKKTKKNKKGKGR